MRLRKSVAFPFLAAVAMTSVVTGDTSERSVYQLDSTWVEDNGHALRLRTLEGDMQLLALIYTTCTGVCPITVKAMQMFSRNIPADIRSRIRYLLVTVDPEQDTLANERDRALKKALGTLKRVYREAVILRDIEGFAYEEIAQTLNINVGTVKSRLARGRQELRRKLEGSL